MTTQLIELEDGLLVEVEVPQDQVNQISGGMPEQVDKAIDSVQPVLLKACRPVVSVWSVERAEQGNVDQQCRG